MIKRLSNHLLNNNNKKYNKKNGVLSLFEEI